jgi:hypothetical protein
MVPLPEPEGPSIVMTELDMLDAYFQAKR